MLKELYIVQSAYCYGSVKSLELWGRVGREWRGLFKWPEYSGTGNKILDSPGLLDRICISGGSPPPTS